MSATPAPAVPGAPSPARAAARIDASGGLEIATVATDRLRATLAVHGEMDLSNAELLAAVADNHLGLGRRFVRLDLSGLTFLDCAGLRIIVGVHNRCLAVRGTLVLTGLTPNVARLLAITQLDEALFVADHPDAAERSDQRLSVVDPG